jgi:flavin reductase (DIM6/NTAB) family NADH-FMN oxidoreductase RutF/DNA-binding IclR family transcriptional regulator
MGQYPTGVVLVSSLDEIGEAFAMIVGSFVSVSLEPALVGFFVDKKSTSWPRIFKTGRFCASVLTAGQIDVCRAFVKKDDDRFNMATWETTACGNPRLVGSAAWLDCRIESVTEAGDHVFVLGRVVELDAGAPDHLPLLFLRGGYGSFTVPSLESPSLSLTRFVRAVEASRSVVESLASELQLGCILNGVVDDRVVVLFAAGLDHLPAGASSRVGLSFELAAPLAPIHVAWQGDDAVTRWVNNGRRILGDAVVRPAHEELERVRVNGYAFSTGIDEAAAFEDTVANSGDALSLDLHDVLPSTLANVSRASQTLDQAHDVTALHFPIFDERGHVRVGLTVNGFRGNKSGPDIARSVQTIERAVSALSKKLVSVP